MTQQTTPGYNSNLVDVDLEDDIELNAPPPSASRRNPIPETASADKETQLINNEQKPNRRTKWYFMIQIIVQFVVNATINTFGAVLLYGGLETVSFFGFLEALVPDLIVSTTIMGIVTWVLVGAQTARDVRVRHRHNLGFNRPVFFDRNKYFHYFFRAEDLIEIGVPLKEWFPRFGRALWRAFIFMMLLQLALTPLTLLVFYIMETQAVTFTWFQAVVFKGIWGATLGTLVGTFVLYMALCAPPTIVQH